MSRQAGRQIARDAVRLHVGILVRRIGAVDPHAMEAERLGAGNVPAVRGLKRDVLRLAAIAVGRQPIDGGARLEDAGCGNREHIVEEALELGRAHRLGQHVRVAVRQDRQRRALGFQRGQHLPHLRIGLHRAIGRQQLVAQIGGDASDGSRGIVEAALRERPERRPPAGQRMHPRVFDVLGPPGLRQLLPARPRASPCAFRPPHAR